MGGSHTCVSLEELVSLGVASSSDLVVCLSSSVADGFKRLDMDIRSTVSAIVMSILISEEPLLGVCMFGFVFIRFVT